MSLTITALHVETANGDLYCPVNHEWTASADASNMTSADGMEAEGEVCLSCYHLIDGVELAHHLYIAGEFFCQGKETETHVMYRSEWAGEHSSPVLCDECHEPVDA